MSEVTSETAKKKWKQLRQAYTNSLHYLAGRQKGTIRSFRTPWAKFNDAGVDGWEWHSLVVIGGRPGSGKTMIKQNIVQKAFDLNPGEDMRILEFQLEMREEVSAIREYSNALGKSYKYLCSAQGKISDEDLQKCYEYAKQRVKYPIDLVEDSPTVDELEKIIDDYMYSFSSLMDDNGEKKRVYKKTVITLDHSVLVKRSKNEKSATEMLYNLGPVLTKLKKKYPILFIVLSQLNKDAENPERNQNGVYGNYVLDSDLFGGDALLQHADILIGINVPAKRKIREYGPDRYLINDETIMAVHFLKCRNGDTRLSFFKTAFDKMTIEEMEEPPPRKEKRLSTTD